MKLTIYAALLSIAVTGCIAKHKSGSHTEAVSDVLTMTKNADGSFNVICSDGSRQTATAEQVNTNSKVCQPTPAPSEGPTAATEAVAPLMPQNLLIGQRLTITVPTDAHVTEYVSSLNYNNTYVSYQIDASSDPTYNGNNSCTWNAQRGIVSTDAAGNQYKYCETAPGSLNGFGDLPHNWAPNHIQISRNQMATGKDGKIAMVASELVFSADINVFDSKMAFSRSRSTFWSLCANKPITVAKGVWVTQNFFGRPVSADVAVCRANLTSAISLGQSPNGTFNQNEFFVAAYSLNYTDNASVSAITPGTCWTDGHPEACESQTFLGASEYKALIEVTLIAKVGTSGKNELDFARDATAFSGASLKVLH